MAKRPRCARCFMQQVLCVCTIIPTLHLRTRVSLYMQADEWKKTTNTGRVAVMALANSELRFRNDRTRPFNTAEILNPDYEPWLLLPTPDAVELTPELVAQTSRPVQLIVPDGTWSQARKVGTREPALKDVRRIKLRPGRPSAYSLRHSPHRENVSTFEAIARALGVIEGAAVQLPLEELFETLIEWHLWSRGEYPREQCRHPIPEAAIQASYIEGCAGDPRVKLGLHVTHRDI